MPSALVLSSKARRPMCGTPTPDLTRWRPCVQVTMSERRKLYSVPKESFCAEPEVKSPGQLMRGASAAFTLRLKSCSPTRENWLSSVGGERGVDVHVQIVFVVLVVVAGGGQRLSADALVLPGPVLIAVLGVGGVMLAELMRGARG